MVEQKSLSTTKVCKHVKSCPPKWIVVSDAGVGDGPWDVMKEFDEHLPARRFDNFNFVDFHAVKAGARNPQAAVALAALTEIPEQYNSIRNEGLLDRLKRR